MKDAVKDLALPVATLVLCFVVAALVILSGGCAHRPDASVGIIGLERPEQAEYAASCLYRLDLPHEPFRGVRIVYGTDGRARTDGTTIWVPAGKEHLIAHELVHVALSRYRPHIVDHHTWMQRAGVCMGGCTSDEQLDFHPLPNRCL